MFFNKKEENSNDSNLVKVSALLIHTAKIWPHEGPGEGHYYAYLKKIGETQVLDPIPLAKPNKRMPKKLNEFIDSIDSLYWMKHRGQFLERNDRWYWCNTN